MLEVTINGSHTGSQALAQHLHSRLVSGCNLSDIECNVKLDNIPEKELVYLVCMT